jgi:hypothetical protein
MLCGVPEPLLLLVWLEVPDVVESVLYRRICDVRLYIYGRAFGLLFKGTHVRAASRSKFLAFHTSSVQTHTLHSHGQNHFIRISVTSWKICILLLDSTSWTFNFLNKFQIWNFSNFEKKTYLKKVWNTKNVQIWKLLEFEICSNLKIARIWKFARI